MNAALLSTLPAASEIFACPTFWALFVGTIGLWLLLPARIPYGKSVGALFLAVAAALFAFDLPLLGRWVDQGVFWVLAAVTLGAAISTIASRSPVYCAISFALSLLATAGLFLFQGAQFLGVATIVVYAGAIVVTLLFVIMLAQPEGHASYDRMSWGWFPKAFGVIAAGTLVGILTFMMGRLKEESLQPVTAEAAAAAHERLNADGGVLDESHMANVGRHLFSEHLVSVELAGTLLLAALVGTIAIAAYGKPRLENRIEEALR
jgi:NADH-quinone oxidoreductase subunit J